MRASKFFLNTQKEVPLEADIPSHQLMLRAGFIKRLGAGLYSWMPVGLRVLRKVEAIVRDEMNKAGALELLMPAVQPKELWEESGRWEVFGPQMLKIKDRHQRAFCFGPTHEEVITDLVRREIQSYKQLPVNFYQIQTKFRDEIRPRFGVMRAREFMMKDAYSFHANKACLDKTYQVMYDTYGRIFTRLGLEYQAVEADSGAIGGDKSHEFHALAATGEDMLAICSVSGYAANVEFAQTVPPSAPRPAPIAPMQAVDTPNQTRCEDVAACLQIDIRQTVKSIALMCNDRFYLALLRGDHSLNEIKLSKLLGQFRFASEDEICAHLRCPPGFIGPVGVPSAVSIVADHDVVALGNFVCGANQPQKHLQSVNFGRDLAEPAQVADIRNVMAGDASPMGGQWITTRGIEIGQVFQLRRKYSHAMQACYLDEAGQSQDMEMGCYGIGISRIVAAAIEQKHDAKGMLLPVAIAPFVVVLCPIGYDKSPLVKEKTDALYDELCAAGWDVLLDDRPQRLGALLADADLIGIPHRLVLGERDLKEDKVAYKARIDTVEQTLAIEGVQAWLNSKLAH